MAAENPYFYQNISIQFKIEDRKSIYHYTHIHTRVGNTSISTLTYQTSYLTKIRNP